MNPFSKPPSHLNRHMGREYLFLFFNRGNRRDVDVHRYASKVWAKGRFVES